MSKLPRNTLAPLVVLALVTVLQPLPPTLASNAGREFSRCVQSCNETRKACDTRCKSDCAEMFPDDKSERDACISACKSICVSESVDCKEVCLAIKNGSPEEP